MMAWRTGLTNSLSHWALKPAPPAPVSLSDPGVILHVLSDADLAGKPLLDFMIDPLHQAPAIGDVIGRTCITAHDILDIGYRVPAQAVGMVFLEPHQRVIAQIVAHFTPAIIGARLAPGCCRAAIIDKSRFPLSRFRSSRQTATNRDRRGQSGCTRHLR